MASFHTTTLKFGGADPSRKPGGLKRLGNSFRAVEILVFLVMVWRFSLPVEGDCVKRLFSALASHRAMFVIGNAIVITLFVKPGKDSRPNQNPELDARCEPNQKLRIGTFIEKCSRSREHAARRTNGTEPQFRSGSVPERLERCTDARVKEFSTRTTGTQRESGSLERSQSARVKAFSDVEKMDKLAFKKGYWECWEVGNYVRPRRILRRTVAGSGGGGAPGGGDEMSDEEFRVMVETFIAKQQRSLREEEKRLSFVNYCD